MKPGVRVLRAGLGALAFAGLAAGAWTGYEAVAERPIASVRFTGDVGRVSRGDLERLAEAIRAMPGGIATPGAVREAAKRVTWVREAVVRRRFPDAIEVRLEAHEALARWNELALVSLRGEVFLADPPGALPRFHGPEGGAAEMARDYPGIVRALAPLGSSVAELKLSARGAWQVVLASGLVLELGRRERISRLERFAAAWPRIAAEPPAPVYADLRYPNGFALRRPAARASKS